uniref:NADH-ubiquinone oxidoreductase chain 2 n=1 Tax=Callulina kreffti TaxID=248777 RepID=S4V126_9NEOB|nr:NADH dehydrogenase subunit 2 [Callulina kreffti]
MNPLALSTFITSLAAGTTITLSAHHWFLAWIGLEINTLAVIPLMTKTPHPRTIEATTKYFLIQATASALILFSSTINAWHTGQWEMNQLLPATSIPITIALAMKLGLAPLHFWMPEVIQGLPLLTGLILSSWQKIAPMFLLIQISQLINIHLITALGLASILISGWSSINQTQLRKLLAFSSIGHLGWMVIIMKFSPNLASLNFIIYITLTMTMFLSLFYLSSTKISQLATSWLKSPTTTALTMLSLLSLGGLPPLTGFMPKLLISLELCKQNAQLLVLMMLLASILALFFYLRLTFYTTLTLPPNTSPSKILWRRSSKPQMIFALLNSLTLLLLPLTPTIILLI